MTKERTPRTTKSLFKRSLVVLFVLSTWAAGNAFGASFLPTDHCVDGTYQVPAGITAVQITAIGQAGTAGESEIAGSPGGSGGKGSKVVVTVPVTPLATLYVNAGSPWGLYGGLLGTPANGNLAGGIGGNAAWVTSIDPGADCAPSSFLVVAAGGGGGGGAGSSGAGGVGGSEKLTSPAGLGFGGHGGNNSSDDGAGGGPGSQTSGGIGGAGGHSFFCLSGLSGDNGVARIGGDGGSIQAADAGTKCQGLNRQSGSGGGGGGGYWGGGGGGAGSDHDAPGGGGGAGSSFVAAGGTLLKPIAASFEPESVTIQPVFTAPSVTSGNSATMVVGSFGSVTFTATGYPLPTITFTGDNVQGVFLDDNGDGTATYSGIPAINQGRVHQITVIATNHDSTGAVHSASQAFTLTVHSKASFASDDHFQFEVGQPGSFTVRTNSGFPLPALSVTSGTLPSGVSFVSNGDGTGTLSGTPAAGSGGVYPLTFTAQSTPSIKSTQNFTLTVSPVPSTTTVHSSANPSAFGQPVTFSATILPKPDRQVRMRFEIDATVHGEFLTDANGTATAAPISSLSVGNHTIRASFTDVGNIGGSSATLTQNVQVLSGAASGTTLTGGPSPARDVIVFNSGTLTRVSSSGNQTIRAGLMGRGVDVDSLGNIFAFSIEFGMNSILEIPPEGTNSFLPIAVAVPRGLAIDPVGNAFVANPTSASISRITPDGTQTTVVSGPPAYRPTGNYFLRAVATDAAGNLYFTDTSPSTDGRVLLLPAPYTAAPTIVASNLNGPYGLAVDAGGTLFIAEKNGGRILKVDAGGVTTVASGLTSPTAVDVDESGALIVGLNGNQIVKLAPPFPFTGTPAPVGTATLSELSDLTLDHPPIRITDLESLTLIAQLVSSPPGAALSGSVTFREGTTSLGTRTVSSNGAFFVKSGLTIGRHTIAAEYGGNGSFPGSLASPIIVDVVSSEIPITVTGSRVYAGATGFAHAAPTLLAGVTLSGTLSGCTTSLASSAAVGSYAGTITGCGGLSLTGANAAKYRISFVDGGVTVTPTTLTVTITATQPFGGSPEFAHSATLPNGTGIGGTLTGCFTILSPLSNLGTYFGQIAGCGGLHPTGTSGGNYTITYADGGVTLVPAPLDVTVTGSMTTGGNPTFQYTQPGTVPPGVTGVGGTLSGCVTSVAPNAPAGIYLNSISGCTGLSASGFDARFYVITYTLGAFVVLPPPTSTPSNTPTSTPTQTPADTATPTATRTPTDTPLPTDTPTSTPMSTPADTATPTATRTPTDTPLPTDTPTNTPMSTPADTATPTATRTPTDTPLPTHTPSPTSTLTASPTATATATSSATATSTRTASATSTATPTPTATPRDTPAPRSRPDLIESLVANPPSTLRRGSQFTAIDTAKNRGNAGSRASATTRYYLVTDTIRVLIGDPNGRPFGNVRDALLQFVATLSGIQLTGKRDVPVLAPSSTSAGSAVLTVPLWTPLGKYYLVACADDGKAVSESEEMNNCTASAATVQVKP